MDPVEKAVDLIERYPLLAYLSNGECLGSDIKGKRVYLSGPITNTKNYKDLFMFANYLVRMCDARQVFDPASQIPDSLGYEEAMKRCVRTLTDNDAIVMFPDWSVSKGSRIEHEVAKACGMDVVYLSSYAVVIDRYNLIKRELARFL